MAVNVVQKARDLLSFFGGLALVYHETVMVEAAVGPRIDLLVIACLLLGVAPATITNRWLGGGEPAAPDPAPTTTESTTDKEQNAPAR